jgi:hypothetical protein
MVDHQAVIVEHLARVRDPSTLSGVPLVYAVDVAPDLPARWPGPRLACRLDLPGYDEATTGWTCASLFCSGTVTHTAVDLAVRMGAEDVVLLGADFGFPGGRAHATEWSWTPDVATRRLTTDGVDGAPLPTDPNLLGYRFDLERYIAERPSIRFWNASRIGARIAGARSYPP